MVNYKTELESNLCECNCGEYTKPGNRFIRGHNRKGKKLTLEQIKACRLGRLNKSGWNPSEKAKENNRAAQNRPETREKKRKALFGRKQTGRAKANMQAAQNRPEVIENNRMHHFGKEMSQETCKKMKLLQNLPKTIEKHRRQAIKMLEDPNSNFGWRGKKESYPEKCFREFLEIYLHQIKGIHFFQEYRVDRYSLDFAWPDEKRYLEIDGGQHLKPESIEHDKKRDMRLKSQEWVGIRIMAKEIHIIITNLRNLT